MSRIERRYFGRLFDGTEVEAIDLIGDAGVSATVLTYGATLQALRAPDRWGVEADVLLGFDTLGGYVEDGAYQGATVGRYANRIAGGQFRRDGRVFRLSANEGPNCLHGGACGWNRAHWTVSRLGSTAEGGVEVHFSHVSPDGDQGFPGEVRVEAGFLLHGTRLTLIYRATTSAPTPINLTSHGYFNLEADNAPVLDHQLLLRAEAFLAVDVRRIPTEPLPVAGTPFNFRQATALGDQIAVAHPQLVQAGGYDHCYVLPGSRDLRLPVAELSAPRSGRRLKMGTTEPGVQLYTGNVLGPAPPGKGGRLYGPHHGVCLETQNLPDAPNRTDFPNCFLKPGDLYESQTWLEFDVAP